jgi:hypothetical protein
MPERKTASELHRALPEINFLLENMFSLSTSSRLSSASSFILLFLFLPFAPSTTSCFYLFTCIKLQNLLALGDWEENQKRSAGWIEPADTASNTEVSETGETGLSWVVQNEIGQNSTVEITLNDDQEFISSKSD